MKSFDSLVRIIVSIYFLCCLILFFGWKIVGKQIPTHSGEQSSLRCSDEGYEHPSKKRKTAQNVSKHSKTNAVNRFSRKRSHSMTSSNSVPMSVSCPGGMYISFSFIFCIIYSG